LDGKTFGKALASELVENTDKVNVKGSFSNPALWNPEFPNCYQVVVSIKNGKKIIHQVVQKFGFRTIEVKQTDGIYVNGKKIMFRGVCRHTFWPSTGRTISKQLAIDDVCAR
jgi:beta-galactosidase/beta-glucuronidase